MRTHRASACSRLVSGNLARRVGRYELRMQVPGPSRGPRPGSCVAVPSRHVPASPHRLACDQPSSCLLALVAANLALIGSGVCRPFGPSRACGAVPASAGAPRGPQGGSRGTCRLAKRPLLTEAIIEPRRAARRSGLSSDPCNRRRPHRCSRRIANHPPPQDRLLSAPVKRKACLTVAPLRLKAAGTVGWRSVRDSGKAKEQRGRKRPPAFALAWGARGAPRLRR